MKMIIIALFSICYSAISMDKMSIPSEANQRMGITFTKLEGSRFIVSKSAILFTRNQTFIYKKNDDNTFVKIEVRAYQHTKEREQQQDTDLPENDENTKKLDIAKSEVEQWKIESSQLESGDTIVVSGAEFINLEEMLK